MKRFKQYEPPLNRFQRLLDDCFPEFYKGPVYCFAAKRDRFWDDFALTLLHNNIETHIIETMVKSCSAVQFIPRIISGNNLYSDLIGKFSANNLIIEMPIWRASSRDASRLHSLIASLESSRKNLILWEWPMEHVSSNYRDVLRSLYEEAIFLEYSSLRKRNQKFCSKFGSTNHYEISTPNGTNVTFERDGPVHIEDCKFSNSYSSFQLPGGEVYFPILDGSANGTIVISAANEITEIRVSNGIAYFPEGFEFRKAPLCEFGIGTNDKAAALHSRMMGEKAYGTCHFGFGENRHLGGKIIFESHFDIVIDSPSIQLGAY